MKNVVEPKLWKEDGIREEIPKSIININSEWNWSGNDESESDGNETEEYEWL